MTLIMLAWTGCSSDGRQGHLAKDGQQLVKLYHCNQDFTFPALHPQPRLGPGAFLQVLRELFFCTNGRQLECSLHGECGSAWHA